MANDPPTDRSGDYDYVGPNQYARVVGERQDGSKIWQAGPRSKAAKPGSIISESRAKQLRGSIGWRNRVKGLVSNPSDETPDNYAEAQEILSDFNSLTDELNAAQKRGDTERVEEIERELDQKRQSLGS